MLRPHEVTQFPAPTRGSSRDELWARIGPLLPVVPRRADHPGRKRLDNRKVLCGILFVLYTGIP
jgi:transposase